MNADRDVLLERVATVAEGVLGLAGAMDKLLDVTEIEGRQLRTEQAELRDGLVALSNRLEALTRTVAELERRGQ